MIEAWAEPFSRAAAQQNEQNQDQQSQQQQPTSSNKNVALVELALIESVVMGVWPFRNILMKNGGASQGKYTINATYLYQFVRDTDSIRNALQMTNRLTGYVYLVDSLGRVRWRGSGNPSDKEIDMMLQCSSQLVKEEEVGGGKNNTAAASAASSATSVTADH
jgi:ATPase complex subunit ATP10